MSMRFLSLACLFGYLSPLVAQESPPSFVIHTATGPLPPAPLVKLSKGWTLRTGAPAPKLIDGADFVALRRSGLLPPPWPEQNVVWLTNGDRIPFGALAGLQPLHEETLHIPCAGGLQAGGKSILSLPQAYVSLILFTAAAGAESPAPALLRLHQAPRSRDVILFKNGDRLEGTIKAFDVTGGCKLEADGRTTQVPLAQLAAAAFNSELQARPRTKQPYCQATLIGGARLSLTTLELDAERTTLSGKLLAGPAVSFPLKQLVALTLRQDRAVDLADLNVETYEATPFFNLTWPLGKDRSVGGGPLRLGEGWYDRGLGMRGQCRVTYRLDGAYTRFEAWAGLDAAAGPRSRMKFSVLVDGKEQDLKAPAARTIKDAPLAIDLDVRGARQLTLRTEFAGFGDVEALTTWADARLIK